MSKKHIGKTFFGESARKNTEQYGQYLMMLTELAISMFDWHNVPDSVNLRFLELTLFGSGHAVFFRDEDLTGDTGLPESDRTDGTYLALQVSMNGRLNVYREPVDYAAYATTGYFKPLNNSNSVIIYNNLLHTDSMLITRIFARRLYNLDRIIDVNSNAQKTPVALICDESERLTYINLFKEIDGNAPVIFGTKNLDLNNIKSINMNAPYVADRLYELKTQYWNEALTYLGITNTSYQKRERLISDEVTRSQGGTLANRYSRLQTRQTACEQINNMFGLNMSCDFKDDAQTTSLLDFDHVTLEDEEEIAEQEAGDTSE